MVNVGIKIEKYYRVGCWKDRRPGTQGHSISISTSLPSVHLSFQLEKWLSKKIKSFFFEVVFQIVTLDDVGDNDTSNRGDSDLQSCPYPFSSSNCSHNNLHLFSSLQQLCPPFFFHLYLLKVVGIEPHCPVCPQSGGLWWQGTRSLWSGKSTLLHVYTSLKAWNRVVNFRWKFIIEAWKTFTNFELVVKHIHKIHSQTIFILKRQSSKRYNIFQKVWYFFN